MCKSKKGGDGGAAAREAQRQQNIQAGYNQIQRIFDGYSTGIDPVSGNYQEGGTYYLSDGTPVTVANQQVANPAYAEYMRNMEASRGNAMNGMYGYGANQTPAPSQFMDQMTIMNGGNALGAVGSQSLFGGKKDVSGFNDDFYNQRATDYVNYATPQLEDQYSKAVKQLTYALAQSGRLNSSTRATQFADLQKQYDMQKTSIADKGRQYANDARSAVDRSRADLVSMNASLADPAQIANEAQTRMAALQAAPSFDALAPLFTNVGEGLATQADLERRNSSRYNTGLFTPSANSAGSSRVIK